MIHNLQGDTLAVIKDFAPDNIAEGDVVLFTLLSRQTCGHYSSGLFRLRSGFAISGKTADEVFILISTIMPDWYWERIYKGALVTETSPLVTVVNNGSYLFTHAADPNSERFCSVTSYILAYEDVTVTPEHWNYIDVADFKPVGQPTNDPSQWRIFPFYTGARATQITLNTGYHYVQEQVLDIAGDLPEAAEDQTLPGRTANGRVLVRFKKQSDNSPLALEYAEEDGVWSLFRTSHYGEDNFSLDWCDSLFVRLNYNWGEMHCTLRNSDGTVTPVSQIGYYGAYINFRYYIFADGAIATGEQWHDNPSNWGYAWPNLQEFKLRWWNYESEYWNIRTLVDEYTLDGLGAWEMGRSTFIGSWNGFTSESTIAYMYSAMSTYPSHQLKALFLMHKDGTHQILPGFTVGMTTSNMGMGVINGAQNNKIIITDMPLNTHNVLVFSKNGEKAQYGSTVQTSTFSNAEVASTAPNDSYTGQSYFGGGVNGYATIYSFNQTNGYVWYIDPVTNLFTRVAKWNEVQIVPPCPPGHCIPSGATLYTGQTAAATTPYTGLNTQYDGAIRPISIYRFESDGVYKSASFIIPLWMNVAEVVSLTMSVTLPPLTQVRVRLSGDNGQTWKRYDSATSHWVTHTDIFTSNTLAEFHAANHTLIPLDIGQDVHAEILLESIDGTATPAWHSFRRVCYTGGDSAIYGEATTENFEYVSSTETRFWNVSALPASRDVKISVHRLI